jgi:hypothetical protein
MFYEVISEGYGLKLCMTLSDAKMYACRLTTLINHALKLERDIWGLLGGPWDGVDCVTHRRTWAAQVLPLLAPLLLCLPPYPSFVTACLECLMLAMGVPWGGNTKGGGREGGWWERSPTLGLRMERMSS